MEGFVQDPQQLFDYDVVAGGDKIGSVDNVWVDDDTERPEFVSVKTGWIFGHDHILPITNATFENKSINVPFSKDQISNAPSFSGDQDLTPEMEQQIFDYYGMQRSDAISGTGYGIEGESTYSAAPGGDVAGYEVADVTVGTPELASDAGTADITAGLPQEDLSDQRTVAVPLSEEELQVGKREIQSGQVRLRKVVRTETRQVPVELRREEIQIERIPANEAEATGLTNLTGEGSGEAFEENVITIPLMEEQPVVAKEAHVVGGVRVTKSVETESQTVSGEVRREDINVDRGDLADDNVSSSFESPSAGTDQDAGR